MGKSKINLYSSSSSQNQTERIENALNLLGLEGIRATFSEFADRAIKNSMTFYDYLEELLRNEISWKEESRINRWIQHAKFPVYRTLSDFDFSFQPSINKQLIQELASCRFIHNRVNVVFFGPPGVGKTHLAIALGVEAIKKGYETRFFILNDLVKLIDQSDGEVYDRLFNSLLKTKLIIFDEIDYHDVNTKVSKFLFELLEARYLHSSNIFTSNMGFSEWANLFGSKKKTEAIVDRIYDDGTIIRIDGDSYRVRDRLKQKRS